MIKFIDLSKVLLFVYARIEDVLKTLTDSIDRYVHQGFYSYGSEKTMRLYISIIRCNDRKRNLNRIKSVVDELLNNIAYCHRVVLIEKFRNERKIGDISKLIKRSYRTTFRILDKAYMSFASALEDRFGKVDQILNEFGSEPVFMQEYNLYLKKKKEE